MPVLKNYQLKAGPVSLVFQPERLFIRYLTMDGAEVLRGVYAALRDHGWGTPAPEISAFKAGVGKDFFKITLKADWRLNDIDFRSRVRLEGKKDGTIIFKFEGKAHAAFRKNRLGFCVLHGAELAGRRCVIEHVDGDIAKGHFPADIAPHQPFFDIRAVTHEAAGAKIGVRVEGDTFEMEDQRNWTDASFKTYCTPLSVPYPATVQKGDTVSQTVTIKVKPSSPSPAPLRTKADKTLVLHVDEISKPVPLPAVGLVLPPEENGPLTAAEQQRIRALNLSHLRLELRLAQPGWEDALRLGLRESSALGLPMEMAVVLGEKPEEETRALAEMLQGKRARIARWIAYFTNRPDNWAHLKTVRELIEQSGLRGKFGTGSFANFTELNRRRPPSAGLDFVCFSANPQAHTFDDWSMAETLETQGLAVQNARAFSGLPVAVTPVRLKPHYKPVAVPAGAGELPPFADPRQATLFGAAWTLGSVKYLAENGAESVTYYETRGWTGVMDSADNPPLPGKFPSVAGGVFPLYHVFAALGDLRGGEVMASTSSRPFEVAGLVLRHIKHGRILLANLREEPRPVRLEFDGLPRKVKILTLTRQTAKLAMTEPEKFRESLINKTLEKAGRYEVKLPAHALWQIDFTCRD